MCAALLYAVGGGRDFRLEPGVYELGMKEGIWLAAPKGAVSPEEVVEIPKLPKALGGLIAGLKADYPGGPSRYPFRYELTVLKKGMVLQATQSYGEPQVHDLVVLTYIREGEVIQRETLEYHWGNGKNVTAAGDRVLIHDGRLMTVWDDGTGETAARIELAAGERVRGPQAPAAQQVSVSQEGQAGQPGSDQAVMTQEGQQHVPPMPEDPIEQTATQQSLTAQQGKTAPAGTVRVPATPEGQAGQTGSRQAASPQHGQDSQPSPPEGLALQAGPSTAEGGTPFYVEGYPGEGIVILRHARSDTMRVLAGGKSYTPYRDLFSEKCRRSIESRPAVTAGVPTGDGLSIARYERGVLWLHVRPGPFCELEVPVQQEMPYPLAGAGE